MAGHPHLFEDQTDEDFFDKLVDDEFGIGESSSIGEGISNLSLGDDEVSGEAAEGKDAVGFGAEADVVSSEEGSSSVVPSESHVFGEAVLPAEEKEGQSKGTSVKVVQWSAFSSSGFGSYSEFFPDNSDSSNAFAEMSTASVEENQGTHVGSYSNSFGQQDGPVFEELPQQGEGSSSELHDVQQYNPDATDSLYWENMYPGWKYDHSTNQWYQVEGQEASSVAQMDGGNLLTSAQEISYTDSHLAASEVVSEQRSGVSCLQTTAQSTVETVAESLATGSVTNWNEISQGSLQYPTNMIFDPQYPEYYYDTITSQWYTLASYYETVQMAAAKDQGQLEVGGSVVSDVYASTQGNSFYNDALNQYENQPFPGHNGDGVSNQWDGQMGRYSVQGSWQTAMVDQSTSHSNFSENQLIGNFQDSRGSSGNFSESHSEGSFSQQASWKPTSSVQTRSLHNLSETHMVGSVHESSGSVRNFPQSHMPGSFSLQTAWEPGTADQTRTLGNFTESHIIGSPQGSQDSMRNFSGKYTSSERNEAVPGQNFGLSNGPASFRGFTPAENLSKFSQPQVGQISQMEETSNSYFGNLSSSHYSAQSYQSANQSFQGGNLSYSQFTSASSEGKSSAGRPPHALVTFAFGGKLLVMKQTGASMSYGSQDASGKTVSILNLAEVVSTSENSNIGPFSHAYFDSLCKHSFPGPLVGGNAATKDLNKWIDDRISGFVSSSLDYKKAEHLRLILSLLKISFQHYGKLRSPFGTDPSILETDGPESAVTKLFASARDNGGPSRDYGSVHSCMHNLPTDAQIRTTSVEVQHLLVSGRRQEALQCAQKGLLWGPALVLAAQLGEKFYVDTVKKMAQYQFISGSPLRTLCLLIAGQPADVFSEDGSSNDFSHGAHASKETVANGMLDSWEENLAIITANRTKDDELVMVHLGDCLWKERDEIVAAHTCYLVAEANFESYSDSARLCLIGADHWKCPRTYASPDAIQRTEFYEYSKVLGNSQFVLLPFQPYKLIYAYMLAEVGRISDSLRYCQAILKILKNSSRAPETETWKQLASSLEDRLRTHQQGGYGSNLAPGKLVGKLFTSIDKSLSRMMGSPPSSLPPMPHSSVQPNGNDNLHVAPKVSTSQSTMAISSLMPSSSGEKINELTGDSRRIMHNRSVSEPDFGRSPKQGSSGDSSSTDSQNKSSNANGSSRFGRFGSQLFQKTIGWVARSRSDRQAKLGGANKFYYDEKLKRWVEEGVDPPPEESALPPPPTAFQTAGLDYNINSALSQTLSSNERTEAMPSTSAEPSLAMPPIPPSTNQFSARGRIGVRSRYVDTFNKGGGVSSASFQAPSAPSKSISSANFFVPAPVASSQSTGDVTEANAEASSNEDASSMVIKDSPYSSLSSSSSSHSMTRFSSVDNITPMASKGVGMGLQGNGRVVAPARAASWSGGLDALNNNKITGFRPQFDAMSAIPNDSSLLSPGRPPVVNGGDDLHEVEL